MGRLLTFLILLFQALMPLPGVAGDFSPTILFPPGQAWPTNASDAVTVEGALLQIELRPGQVISAQKGARLSLVQVGGSDNLELGVLQGSVIWLDMATNTISPLLPGTYAIAPAGLVERGRIPRDEPDTLAPGYRLADAVMTQQQKYLDSLKVDVRDINHFLASIIRGLVPRRP
jgi:hypothetical protein